MVGLQSIMQSMYTLAVDKLVLSRVYLFTLIKLLKCTASVLDYSID